jgi:transcriptional regulator with XRE-family HTH domain
MPTTFAEQIRVYIQRRNLPVERLATQANLSRKTLYRWVNGEVSRPRHWYELVSLGKVLRLSVDEMNELLWLTQNPGFFELKDLARYEYEFELLEDFLTMERQSGSLPPPQTRIAPWTALEAPTGAMRPESPFYIERSADNQLQRQLDGQGTTTTIMAGRQTGKTSLLIHTIHASRPAARKVIYLDFQLVYPAEQDDLSGFLRVLSEAIAEQIELDWKVLDGYWQNARNPTQTFNRFIQREVLTGAGQNVLLAIDEADLLLDASYKQLFFSLLRSWDSRRAFDPGWRKLNLVMVVSTHPYLLIDDVKLSPFNVGLTIQLKDFTSEQVAELNRRHSQPLKPDEIPSLMELVGGHPYLVRQAFYTLVSEGLSLPELSAVAASPDGPFGRHLSFYAHNLKKSPGLLAAFQQALQGSNGLDETTLERLGAVGLVHQQEGRWQARCGLYEQFFSGQSG